MTKYQSMPDNTKEMVEDPSCTAFGCPLSSMPNQNYCSFHTDCTDVQKTTHAINQHTRWISGYRAMVNWTPDQWGRYRDSLKQNEFCAMKDGELPSQYLNRFHFKLFEVIA